MTKPSLPKGTRDFSPAEMVRRNYIFDIIREVFHRYGYQPIETPAMENLSTLTGKYGEEGDRLIFKVLNSGDYLSKVDHAELPIMTTAELTPRISEKALRYDLTVPFARYVVQHRHEITFPFKRYQVQPVWRADRPQKGRYREFFQCDADVIGSDSLLNETELVRLVDEVLSKLSMPSYRIKVNNRKVLTGFAALIGEPGKLTELTVAMDKLGKMTLDAVCHELTEKGLSDEAVNGIRPILELTGSNNEKFDALRKSLAGIEEGLRGLDELEEVFAGVEKAGALQGSLVFEPSLARGLDYYTGAIFEVTVDDAEVGSITGGGRYDDLAGIFGLEGVSGVGISFGADRIYDVLDAFNLFPDSVVSTTQVFFVNFGKEEEDYCLPLLTRIRAAGINAELYPDHAKMKKQMQYANNKGIPYVVLVGKDEMASGKLTVKDMESGKQEGMSVEELVERVGGKQ